MIIGGLVSFIVPVYNGEKYIRRCLNSICRQSYPDIEVVVVNDGSTDSTEKILEEMSLADNRIRVFSKKNGGVSTARNYALKVIKGDYVFFVDADDWIDSEMTEYNIKMMHQNNVEIVVNDFYYNESGYKDTFSQDVGDIPADIIRKSLIISDNMNSQCISLYSVRIIRENNILFPEDIKSGEDNIFNILYVDCIKKGFYTKKAFYHYEIHKNSGCRRLSKDQLEMYGKQLEFKKWYGDKWGIFSDNSYDLLLQLVSTHLAAFTLMAVREYKFNSFVSWMNEVYNTNVFKMLKQNKGNLGYKYVPRTYRILLWLIVKRITSGSYLYCKCVNYILGQR